MDLQSNDRVMEPTGHAGTIAGTLPDGTLSVVRDMDGESRPYAPESLTKLATRESAVATRGGTVAPRAWTMGGSVD